MPLWNFLNCCAIPDVNTEGVRLADDVLPGESKVLGHV